MEIEKIQWKPIMDPSFEKLLVDRTGQSYNYHPIIILEMDDNLIFIKARSARYGLDKNNNVVLYEDDKKILEENKGILINKTNYGGIDIPSGVKPLFKNDSIVDTTQLYVMAKKDFQKFYDLDKNENFYHTGSLKLEQREWILEDLIKNLHDKKISLTSIYYDDVGTIKTKLIYSDNELLNEDINNRKREIEKTGKDRNIKDVEIERLDLYKKKYDEYINNKINYESAMKQLTEIDNIFKKELKETYGLDSCIRGDSDQYYYFGTAGIYKLDLDQEIYDQFSKKEYDQQIRKVTLSNYRSDFYDKNLDKWNRDFPDVKKEFDSYCKRLSNIKDNLEETEKNINKISDKNTRKEFNELKAEFDLTYQHEILTNDVLDEYDNKINEIDKSLNKDQEMTL